MNKKTLEAFTKVNEWWVLGRIFNDIQETRVVVPTNERALNMLRGLTKKGFGPCSFDDFFAEFKLAVKRTTLLEILNFMRDECKLKQKDISNLFPSNNLLEENDLPSTVITINDDIKWQRLARITGKTIHLLCQSGGYAPLLTFVWTFKK